MIRRPAGRCPPPPPQLTATLRRAPRLLGPLAAAPAAAAPPAELGRSAGGDSVPAEDGGDGGEGDASDTVTFFVVRAGTTAEEAYDRVE